VAVLHTLPVSTADISVELVARYKWEPIHVYVFSSQFMSAGSPPDG
jgi:hypothetical protein